MNIPKITDNDKIILVQYIKIPLFLVIIFNINNFFFQEKLSWIKYMTKTLEFQTEELNKKLNEIVSSTEIIESIN